LRQQRADHRRLARSDLTGELDEAAGLVDAMNEAWRPYVGAGVGTANLEIGVDGGDYERDWVLAYQLIGGVAYDVTPNWSLNGEVRWFATEGGRYNISGSSDNAKADWETVDVLVGATYRF
jgi:opacity protein-like surface antigen